MTDQWEQVETCPLCGASGWMPVTMAGKPIGTLEQHGITVPIGFAIAYQECMYCGMIYQNPRLTEKGLHQFYTGGLYEQLTTPSDYKTEKMRADRLVNLIKPLEIKSILDLGCGHGEFLQACRDKGIVIQGYDVRKDAIEGIPVATKFDQIPLTVYDFVLYDMVSLIHLIEHVQDPVNAIKEALPYSKRYIMVEVPLTDPLNYRAWYLNLPHVLIFKTHTLVDAMQRAGVKVTGLAVGDNFVTAIGEKDG